MASDFLPVAFLIISSFAILTTHSYKHTVRDCYSILNRRDSALTLNFTYEAIG